MRATFDHGVEARMARVQAGSIVVGLDGSGPSTTALDWAIDEAARRARPLHLVHAWGVEYGLSAELFGPPEDLGDELLEEARDRVARRSPDLPITIRPTHSFPASALIELSRRADTVVVGARGRGAFGAAVLGSVSLTVTMHAACPVVVVRGSTPPREDAPVVVGVDGSESSHLAVEHAFAQAASREAPLVPVHAWDVEFVGRAAAEDSTPQQWSLLEEQGRELLEAALAVGRERHPKVEVRPRFVRDYPSRALLVAAEDAQLLVVGSRGRGGFRGLLLGSVSHRLIQQADCPVLVVRPRGGT